MPGWARIIAVAALVVAAAVGAAGPARADLREFIGRIQDVSGERVVVRNRSGDQRHFARTKRTQVVGQRSQWTQLRGGDSVIVTWSLDDDPVECRRIDVLSTSGSQ
jgi:hypothetical protein